MLTLSERDLSPKTLETYGRTGTQAPQSPRRSCSRGVNDAMRAEADAQPNDPAAARSLATKSCAGTPATLSAACSRSGPVALGMGRPGHVGPADASD